MVIEASWKNLSSASISATIGNPALGEQFSGTFVTKMCCGFVWKITNLSGRAPLLSSPWAGPTGNELSITPSAGTGKAVVCLFPGNSDICQPRATYQLYTSHYTGCFSSCLKKHFLAVHSEKISSLISKIKLKVRMRISTVKFDLPNAVLCVCKLSVSLYWLHYKLLYKNNWKCTSKRIWFIFCQTITKKAVFHQNLFEFLIFFAWNSTITVFEPRRFPVVAARKSFRGILFDGCMLKGTIFHANLFT